MNLSEKLIYCTTKITSIYDESNFATGTGFFMGFNVDSEKNTYQPVIITNKHVVKDAKIIIFSICKGDNDNNPLDREKVTINLENFKIIEHPNNEVDLCAILISSAELLAQKNNINLFKCMIYTDSIITKEEINACSAIEDIIMIGYPNGLEDTYNNKPIIRKGITSTHLKFDYNGKKEFLIDMACFPGSSGSPIFLCNESSYAVGGNVIIGKRCKLLGLLYAGPYYTGEGKIVFENIPINPKAVFSIPNNLGLVIKAERIKELEDIMKDMNK